MIFIKSKKMSRKGRSSNYSYGRRKEYTIGRERVKENGGGYFRRTPGSRGPSDLLYVYPNGKKEYIQVKSSRKNSIGTNHINKEGKKNLIEYSEKRGGRAVVYECKGIDKKRIELN